MSNNVLWAGPRLLVPMTVEALVVTAASNATLFSVQALHLSQYKRFGIISPQPFVNSGQPAQGVYLNWALPDGMTQGIKKQGANNVDYPFLPNRWMIVRFSADASVPRAAWIVESDYWFGSNQPSDNRLVNSMFINADDSGNPQISIIGQAYDFDSWTENGQNSELFLNAVGNSDPMFTAYAGNNAFVFNFVDPYTNANAAEMSYMVCGWYSNPQYDPLYNQPIPGVTGWTTEQDWLDLMTQLQWSVGSEAIADNIDLTNAMQAAANWLAAQGITPLPGLLGTLCAQSLCHGLVFDVQWPGNNVEPPSNVPVFNSTDKSVPYVAAGNTSTDCMAAFMQWQLNYNNPNPHNPGQDSDVELLLEAFNYKMLPQPGAVMDTPELMNAMHNAWFGKLPGGTIWVVQTQPNNDKAKSTLDSNQQPNTNAPASLTPQQATALANLNAQQAAYDADCRQLISMQVQLYADWMKMNLDPIAPIKTQLAATLAAVNVLIAQLSADEALINAAHAVLVADLSTANLQVINKPGNSFYTPNDPVFLVNNAKRSYKRGEDIIYSKDNDSLFVRFTGQFIKSLQVNTGTSEVVVNGSVVCPPLLITNQVPKEIPALLTEAYLLDTTFANNIAQIAMQQTNPPQSIINTIQQQQTLIWNAALDSSLDQRTLEQISGFNPGDPLFHVPSKIGVWQWQQPWNPLYLEWQVNFYQAVDTGLSQWVFDGSDYSWGGGNIPVNNQNQQPLKGRSLLTPVQAVTLQSQLQDFLNTYKGQMLPNEYIPLKDVLNGVGDWDVLSQTLKGLTMQLIQWDIQQFGYIPTTPEYAEPMEYVPGNPTQVQAVGHGMPIVMNGTPFYPVRAGFVEILQLWVVDDFGQVYDLNPSTSSGGGVPNPMPPIPAIGFEPGSYSLNLQLPQYFQLPPRVIQGSRLDFNFVSANNDAVLSNQDVATTPICGWILPNHIDDSVSVYDNTGQILGELTLMGATGAQHAQWVAAPLIGVSSMKIANAHLQSFVQGLLGNTGNDEGSAWSGRALANFMLTIDETLWSVDPLGERDNQNLSILIGRPIAVIRASLQLELYGNPATDLTIAKTGQNYNGNIAQYSFDTQIGNIDLTGDGVMGYFNADNYSQFNSVHYGEVVTPASPPYVVNSFTKLQFLAESPSYITLLLDPRGSIHTSSGILPVLEIILPDLYVGDVMNNMLLEFKTGPLIMDTQTWKVPLPAGAGLKWSWLQPAQVEEELAWTEVTSLVNQTAAVQLPINSPSIREGKLKLTGALGSQPSIYFFGVNNFTVPYTIPAGITAQLSWAAQGASATLTIDKGASVSVPLNSAGYAFNGSGTQVVTLAVLDGTGAVAQTIPITIITES